MNGASSVGRRAILVASSMHSRKVRSRCGYATSRSTPRKVGSVWACCTDNTAKTCASAAGVASKVRRCCIAQIRGLMFHSKESGLCLGLLHESCEIGRKCRLPRDGPSTTGAYRLSVFGAASGDGCWAWVMLQLRPRRTETRLIRQGCAWWAAGDTRRGPWWSAGLLPGTLCRSLVADAGAQGSP